MSRRELWNAHLKEDAAAQNRRHRNVAVQEPPLVPVGQQQLLQHGSRAAAPFARRHSVQQPL